MHRPVEVSWKEANPVERVAKRGNPVEKLANRSNPVGSTNGHSAVESTTNRHSVAEGGKKRHSPVEGNCHLMWPLRPGAQCPSHNHPVPKKNTKVHVPCGVILLSKYMHYLICLYYVLM